MSLFDLAPFDPTCGCAGTGTFCDGRLLVACEAHAPEYEGEEFLMEHPHGLMLTKTQMCSWVDELMVPIIEAFNDAGFTTFFSCQGDDRVFEEISADESFDGLVHPSTGSGYLYGADDPSFVALAEHLIENPILAIEREPTFWDGSPGITLRWLGEVRSRNVCRVH